MLKRQYNEHVYMQQTLDGLLHIYRFGKEVRRHSCKRQQMSAQTFSDVTKYTDTAADSQ